LSGTQTSQSPVVTTPLTVDARGKRCPVPLAIAKVRVEALPVGGSLTVLATDPEAPLDIGAWATDHGHDVAVEEREGWVEIQLTKGG
jgi:TusA-related sulfurtransferase